MVKFSNEDLLSIVEFSKAGYSESVIANKLGVSKHELEEFLSSAAAEHTRDSGSVDALTFRDYLRFRDDDRLSVLKQLKNMGMGHWVAPSVDEFGPAAVDYPPIYIKGNSRALKDYLNFAYPQLSTNRTIARLSYELEEAKKELEWFYKNSDVKYNVNEAEDMASRVLQETVLSLIDQSVVSNNEDSKTE